MKRYIIIIAYIYFLCIVCKRKIRTEKINLVLIYSCLRVWEKEKRKTCIIYMYIAVYAHVYIYKIFFNKVYLYSIYHILINVIWELRTRIPCQVLLQHIQIFRNKFYVNQSL